MQDIYQTGLPTRAALGATGLHLELREIAPNELRDAFMQETIKRVPARNVRIEIAQKDVGVGSVETAPAGLIFHVARCGSTLASQLLKLHEQVIVYSEPQPFNELLAPPHRGARADLISALRSLGAAFARHAGRRYVLKLTSWNTLYCDLLADAFPSTPWVLCIRDPVEVCVSLLEHRPGWLSDGTPAQRLFAPVIDPNRSSRTAEEYGARAYAGFAEAALRLEPRRGKLVRYEALPDAVWRTLAPHFDISVDEGLRDRMREASRIHAKSPLGKAAAFVPDAERKRAAATPPLRDAIETIARPAFERLLSRFGGG
jgi:hypothetical protein